LALLFLATQRGGPKKSTATPSAVADRPVPSQPGGKRPSSTSPRIGPSKTDQTQPAHPIILNPPDTVPGADSPAEPTAPGTAPAGTPGQDAAGDSDDASGGTDVPTAEELPTENIDDPFMNDPEETPSATATPPTAEELAELSKTLTTARNAAGEHEFRIARMQLVKAGTLARLPEHQAMVTRLDRLVSLSEQFWVAVRQAMSELQGAEELPIGDSGLIVIVVDVKPGVITIRRNGRNESFLVPDMPPGLAFAIADRKLDAAASDTSLMKGACLGAMKNPKQIYIDEAKRYWEIARTQGVQVDDLLLALSDTYELK
jgi:hypothetical protein